MIAITFAIQNPFFQSWKSFKNLRHWHGSTRFKNKYWEAEVLKSGDILLFDFTVRTRCDHSGVTLSLGLFNYSITVSLYDNRHWDHGTDDWKKHD